MATPAHARLGDLAPDMVRLDAETKQITHTIRMAAYNSEITLARALHGRYARAGDEADAMHAQREHARYLVAQRGAHYILTVKGNQPSLHT